MKPGAVWDWPESRVRRKVETVGRQIYWSYAGLSVTRQRMRATDSHQFINGRGMSTNIEFHRYVRGERRMGPLEREIREQALNAARCVHCGAADAREMDHLIPRSKGGYEMPFNTAPSCQRCNRSRGKKDLMLWYRKRRTFPCLALLRHYLKLCHACADRTDLLDKSVEDALAAGLPFDPRLLPTKYPPIDQLVWDWRFPNHP